MQFQRIAVQILYRFGLNGARLFWDGFGSGGGPLRIRPPKPRGGRKIRPPFPTIAVPPSGIMEAA